MSSCEMKFERTIACRTSVWRSLAESGCRTGFDSVGLRAVEAFVEVELHDLVFAVGLAQLVGKSQLFDLAADRLFGRQELLLGQLLRDGAATTDDPAGADVVERGADDADEVEAGVRVEALVLDRNSRLDRDRRDVLELDRKAVVAMVADVRQHDLAGAVVDDRVARERGGVEALDRGQAVEEGLGIRIGRDADHEHDRDYGPQRAEQRGPAHLLPDRRPRGVNPRSRTMSPLRLDPLRYVSSHAWGAQGFYAFQFPPTEGKEGGLRGAPAANSGEQSGARQTPLLRVDRPQQVQGDQVGGKADRRAQKDRKPRQRIEHHAHHQA